MSKFQKFLRVSIVSAAVGLLATQAQAVSLRQLLAFDLVVSDASQPDGQKRFGTVRAFKRKLERAGWKCNLDTYEYGGNLDCTDVKGGLFFIGLSANPTAAPEFAEVDSIRPNAIRGPNGIIAKELPAAEYGSFLQELLSRPAAR